MAQLLTSERTLGEADEEKLDTPRLQQALDHCGNGKAVELAMGGANDAFLAATFTIPEGVTLLVDRGVTLYASRDARLYDLPDSGVLCGYDNWIRWVNTEMKKRPTVIDVAKRAQVGASTASRTARRRGR